MIDSASEQASTLHSDHRKSCDGRLRFDANQESFRLIVVCTVVFAATPS